MKNNYTHTNINSFYGIVRALANCKTVDRLTKVNDKWIRGRGRVEHNGHYDMAGDETGMVFYPDYLVLVAKHMELPIEEQIRCDVSTQLPCEAREILRFMRYRIDELIRGHLTTTAEEQEQKVRAHLATGPFAGDWLRLYDLITELGECDNMDIDTQEELYPETSSLEGRWFDDEAEPLLVPLTPMHYIGNNEYDGKLKYGQYGWTLHLPGTRSMLMWYMEGEFGDYIYKSMPLWFTANR